MKFGVNCLVLVDVLVTLGGVVVGGRSGSMVDDGSGDVCGEGYVSRVFGSGVIVEEVGIVVDVGDDCGDCRIRMFGVVRSGSFDLEKGNWLS
ncbi:hypothetical protein Tco_1100852 [Tanacetum coccineum]